MADNKNKKNNTSRTKPRRKGKRAWKKFRSFILIALLFGLGLMVGAGIIFGPKLTAMWEEAKVKVSNIKADTFIPSQTSLVYDSNGEIITKIKGEKDSYYLNYEEIPKYFIDAFVATEDKNFYNHHGIDIKGIGRAVVGLLKNREISGGGSTITQQLSRNIFLTHEVSFERKIKEIFISLMLEKIYSKNEIIEFYVNSIFFSNGAYGIEAASRKYFSKSADELTLGEVAFISAIPNNPSLYNPFRMFENTIGRKNRILGYMLEDGYITQEEHDAAVAEEIVLNPETTTGQSSSVTSYIIDNATETLMQVEGFTIKTSFKSEKEEEEYKKAYNEAYSKAQDMLYTKGYKIYTSIDMNKQRLLEQILSEELAFSQETDANGIYSLQGSATTIDNQTGKVVAIVGGRTQENSSYGLNRAYQGYRQPGSTFKPLAVYTPAFERGYLPSTIVNDVKSSDGPRNYNEKYEGPITITWAIQDSKNTIAWNIFKEIGPKTGLAYIKKMEFKKIVDSDYTLSAALGGLTYGTTTLEMASAYSTIARDGYFYSPTCIVKIEDLDGNVVYNDATKPVQVYTERASRIMTHVLQSVMTGGSGRSYQLSNMPSAGKTGTTNDIKDSWFCGYTPYYTTSIWIGYDIPKSLGGGWGTRYPGNIWKKFNSEIHANLPYKEFGKYEGLEEEEEALNEAIKKEEERKVLIVEIDSELSIFMSKEINSMSDVTSLEAMYSSLMSKINQLEDSQEKTSYLEKVSARKSYIDKMKTELKPPVVETPEVPPTTPDTGGEEITPPVEETPIIPPTPDEGTEEIPDNAPSDGENVVINGLNLYRII